jgi:hypothetical protein
MHPIRSLSKTLPAMLAMGVAALLPGNVDALTLGNLKGAQLDGIYGTYAPRGDCTREPRITVDDSGLAYMLGGKSTHSGNVEYAVSYGGQEYTGISQWIFPFPVSDDDFGRVLMTFNADEKAGKLLVDPDLGPGQGLSALQAALVKASPFARCAKGK